MTALGSISAGGYNPLQMTQQAQPHDEAGDSFEKALHDPTKDQVTMADFNKGFDSLMVSQSQHLFANAKQNMDAIYDEEKTPPKNNKKV